MYPISETLKVRNNILDSYLPVRTKGNDFDWELITGLVLSHALKKQIRQYEFHQFEEDCKARLIRLLDDPGFWDVLQRMYFSNKDIYKISPLFLLFKAQFKGSGKADLKAANWRLGSLFANLLENFSLQDPVSDKLNFIEQEMLEILHGQLKISEKNSFGLEQPYLPYLADAFQKDMKFLTAHPKYMLQELVNTLKVYSFAYCAQLALNIRDWKSGEPRSKPLFFILDTERASSERTKVHQFGYKMFSNLSEQLFPILSALEVLQRDEEKRPLWQVYSDSVKFPDQQRLLSDMNQYCNCLAQTVVNAQL